MINSDEVNSNNVPKEEQTSNGISDIGNEKPNFLKQTHLSSLNDSLNNNKIVEAFRDIEGFEENDSLDTSYNKLITNMQKKFMLIESMRIQNEAMEERLKEKFERIPSHLFNMKSDSLKKIVEARREELLTLLDQQIDDLEHLEEDMRTLTRKFSNNLIDDEAKSLRENVYNLQVNIQKKIVELRLYKKDICANSDSEKSMEESIGLINSLNEKLTKLVEQMTNEISKVRSQVNKFSFVRVTASNMILSMVPKEDQD